MIVHNRTQIKFIIMTMIPIVISLFFFPLWKLSMNIMALNVLIPVFTICLNTIITPVYLIYTVKRFSKQHHFILCLTFSVVALYGSSFIQFINWGIATGLLMKPDASTLLISRIETIISSIIFAIGLLYIYLKK